MSTQPPQPPIVIAPGPQHVDIPCCSPATTESVAVVRDKVADARSDVLVGQGHIMKTVGDSTSAVLRDANANSLFTNANIDRSVLAAMSQTDKYGLANLQATDRNGVYGAQTTRDESERLNAQANTIAWNQLGIQNASFSESRGLIGDSFARLSSQGENGFYRTGVALNAGFSDISATQRDSYARLSEQHCQTKETIAAYGNRSSDQHAALARDIHHTEKALSLQAANNFGVLQLEASKNTAAIQLQAAANAKESLLEQSKWFALAEKTAMVNKCELEAKMAACCCEIKELVSGTATSTQALIRDTDATRVRDALAATATENAILKLRREERHHYPVFVGGDRDRDRRGDRD